MWGGYIETELYTEGSLGSIMFKNVKDIEILGQGSVSQMMEQNTFIHMHPLGCHFL